MKSAREWLAEVDLDTMDGDLFQAFIERVGYDKAWEVRSAMRRMTENLLDALGDLLLSETSLLKLNLAISQIAVDNYIPRHFD